jgi:hypothetical protein
MVSVKRLFQIGSGPLPHAHLTHEVHISPKSSLSNDYSKIVPSKHMSIVSKVKKETFETQRILKKT